MDHLAENFRNLCDKQDYKINHLDEEDPVFKSLTKNFDDDSDAEESDGEISDFGYVQTTEREVDSTNWLSDVEAKGLSIDKVIKQYKDDVMLRKVFGLTGKNDDILKSNQANRILRKAEDPNQGQRFRNMSIIYIDKIYYIIHDDTNEVINSSKISEFTASLSIMKFDP